MPIQDVCELEPLTDIETEHAIQALQRQSSSNHISSTTTGSLFFGPASPSPGVQLIFPNPATPTADIQPAATDIQLNVSSPAMPVLEPQVYNSAAQQPDNQHLSPYPETLYPPCDPYPLAPVLSPQLPFSSYIMEPHSPYSEPPVLSPQQYTPDESVEGVVCGMDTPLLPSLAVTNTGVMGSNQEDNLVFSGIMCSSNGLKCDKLVSRRSRSLSRQSSTAPNPKKRCRSASPDLSQSKRTRFTVDFGYSCKWTEHNHKSAKQKSDTVLKSDSSLFFDKDSCQILQSCPNINSFSTSTTKTVGLKHTFTAFCVPAVQNSTQAPYQIDILTHGSTTVTDRGSSKIFDPPHQFSNNKSHSVFSSQDSQRSLSHSTSVCIESALIPDLATLAPSSDSDWDCDLLSRLCPTSATPSVPTEQICDLDKELLHRPCNRMHNSSYESRLHIALQPSTAAEMDPSAFSRTVVQIVEVQH